MKTAAIYVRVSTADQHVESQLYDLRELAAQRGFEVVQEYQDCGVSGKRAQTPRSRRAHRGCAAEEILRRARRRVRPSREECQAFPASHGRVRQSGRGFHFPARERGHQRPDGTALPDADWLDCRTRIGLDPRACFGWHAEGEAGRCANRTRSDELGSCSHRPRPTQRNDTDGCVPRSGAFPAV